MRLSSKKSVAIGLMKFQIRSYIPGPMRCKNRLQYNHMSKNCSHKPRCLHCGKQGHCQNQNEAEVRCANCGGGHTADDKTCPKCIQVRNRLRETAAAKRPTNRRALVGDTNTVAAAAIGASTEDSQNS